MTAPCTWYAVTQPTTDYYWRITAPARAIDANLNLIPQDGGLYAVMIPNDDTAFHWTQDEDGTSHYPNQEGGACIWTRPDLLRATHMIAMERFHGMRTVSESDDNYMSDVKFNIFMKSNKFDVEHRKKHLQAMASANACIFSTEYLRDSYIKAFKAEPSIGKRKMPKEMHVIGNHVFLEDWPEIVPRDGPVRVGWMGSPSHLWDVDLAWPALLAASRAGARVTMIGYDPANPEGAVESPRAINKVKQWRKVGHEYIDWIPMDWKSRLQLPLDIGLAPLLTNDFTKAKSDIKAIEYTIAGAAVVASNMEVFNRNWIHGETALLAGSPSEMIDHTLLLMRDEKLRRTLVENAQQYVREERNLWDHAGEWYEAITGYSMPSASLHRQREQLSVAT